jgi:hypothetical protein
VQARVEHDGNDRLRAQLVQLAERDDLARRRKEVLSLTCFWSARAYVSPSATSLRAICSASTRGGCLPPQPIARIASSELAACCASHAA